MFSGIGGAELALPEAQWIWCAEIEKFPAAVLETRFGHPNLGDITADDFIDRARAFGPLDLLCGGPPCQAFSIAGLRNSMQDARGNLSLRFIQVAHALADTNGLRNLLVENVPGWLNTPDNAFGCFLGGLVGADDALLPCERPRVGKGNDFWTWRKAGKHPVLDDEGEETGEFVEREAMHIPKWPRGGMVAGPRARAAWRVLDAQYAGLAQRRQRVFLVADFGEGADPAAVLFERGSLHGNHPPRRETGQGVTGTLSARTEVDGAQPLMAGGPVGGNQGGDYIAQPIAFSSKDHGADATPDLSPTLRAMGHAGSHANAGGQMAVAIQAGALRENPNSGPDGVGVQWDMAYTLEARAEVQAVAFQAEPITIMERGRDGVSNLEWRQDGTSNAILTPNGGRGGLGVGAVAFAQNQRDEIRTMDVAGALAAEPGMKQQTYIAQEWAVRRLTVTECEKLQGYPVGHTLIEFGSRRTLEQDEADYLAAQGAHIVVGNDGKLRTNVAADGPRYKALGNAWAVACVRPIALNLFSCSEGRAA